MAKGFQQFASLTNESSYGVTQAVSPTTTWLRLTDNNALTVLPQRMFYHIRSADGRNRKVVNVPGRTAVTGKYTGWLYSDTGSDSVPFCDRILAWATTLTSDELASYTLRRWDGVRNREYLGGKVRQLKLSGAADQNEGCVKVELDLVFQKANATDPVTFAEPAITVFPKAPYRFQESSAGTGLQVYTGGSPSTRSIYKNFELTITNLLYPSWDNQDFISDLTWNGRDIEFSFTPRFTSKADRDAYEAQTSYTAGILFTKVSPAHTLQLTLNGQNFISAPVEQAMDLGQPTYETLHFNNFLDTTVPGDFSYASA